MVKNENDYEKRKLLIEAAKKEFLEKGYNKASLRNICAKAGMTTGALYFFFNNKENLYSSIVNPPIEELKKIVIEHYREDREFMGNLSSMDMGEQDSRFGCDSSEISCKGRRQNSIYRYCGRY